MIRLSVVAGGFIMFILLQDSAHRREAKSRDTQTHTAGYGKVGSYIIINREKNFILQNDDFSGLLRMYPGL